MHISFANRFFKLGFVAALVVGVVVAGLSNGGNITLAQEEMEAQSYIVQAGAGSIGNAELLAFAPANLQVHRGDTVTWSINGFHNVSFHEDFVPLVIAPEVDGQPVPQFNPAVALPSIENGGTFTGGAANSGLPEGPTFSLVMDAEPGVYTYQCDIHPGMIGTVEVVADETQIPTPIEAVAMGGAEIGQQFQEASAVAQEAIVSAPTTSTEGSVDVMAGLAGTGRVAYLQFFSPVVTISAGETVNWVNPEGSNDIHFVNSVPFDAATMQDIVPQMAEGAPPVFALGPGFLGTTQSGATVAAGEGFNSTGLAPGDTFSVTFNDPGVYPYLCHIHPGMNGVVVVQ